MSSEKATPLQKLSGLGQSVWVDFLSRHSIRGGHLQELIDDYSVVGATSNPTIFEKAMSSGDAYDEQLSELAEKGVDLESSFWALAQQDIQDACDLFRPVWDGGGGREWYVPICADGAQWRRKRCYPELQPDRRSGRDVLECR